LANSARVGLPCVDVVCVQSCERYEEAMSALKTAIFVLSLINAPASLLVASSRKKSRPLPSFIVTQLKLEHYEMLTLVVLLFGKLFDKPFLRSTTTTTTSAAAAVDDDDDDDNDDDVRRSYSKTTTLLTSIDQ